MLVAGRLLSGRALGSNVLYERFHDCSATVARPHRLCEDWAFATTCAIAANATTATTAIPANATSTHAITATAAITHSAAANASATRPERLRHLV